MEEYSKENGNLTVLPKPRVIQILTKERKILGRSKRMRWITDSGFIIVLAIIFFLGVSYLIRSYSIGKNIFLEARVMSEKISSGNLEIFELSYKNDNKESVYDAQISLEFPGNFILDQVLPADIFDAHTNIINLGDLASGANGKIKISGYVLGEVGSQQFMKFSLNYSKDGLNRKCQNIFNYLIEDSVLDFKFSLPEDLYQDVLFSKELTLHNQGNRELDNLRIILDDNIYIQNINNFPGLSFDAHNIYLERLKVNEEVSLNLDLLVRDVEGQQEFSFTSEANGLKQNSFNRESFIKVPKFKVSIIPGSGQSDLSKYLNFTIDYKNNEEGEIGNISLDLKPIVNFVIKGLRLDDSRFTMEGNTIFFKDSLTSQESGNLNIKVLLNKTKTVLNQGVGIWANINYNHQGQKISYPNYSDQINLCSDLKIKSAGYYYSPQGDQLGTGPLPPMVDVPTSYWIFWEIDNYGNDLNSFTLSADLPEELVWTNNKSILAGDLQYGEVSRRIVWSVNNVASQNGKYEAKFEIGLIPTEQNIGQVMDLLKNIKFIAQDSFCGSQISGTVNNIDTSLPEDDLINNKSRVVDFK